ncbi:MAG: hypothetical protein LQ343_001343 [Gyalolechia ehrenbergii]|nr:MAG: hypothetical protein LQ343_001343 [Gyalolechia ehrenbergii]
MLLTIIILALTASNAYDFSSRLACSVPSKLGYNIAASVLSFIVLVVLLLSTGPKPALRVIPWFIWGQLVLDVFMWIIWIAAAGVSTYNCNDLCSACSQASELWANGLYCICDSYFWYKRDQSPAPKAGLARSLQERAYRSFHGPGAGRVAGKVALDSIITVTFAFTTAMTIFWIFRNRRSAAAAASSTTTTAPQQPASGPVAQSAQVFPNKMDGPYTGQPLQQGSYPAPGQNIPMHHGGYTEPAPNTQPFVYPNTGVQVSIPEYYSPDLHQSQPQQTQYPPNHAEMGSRPTE